VLKRAAIEFRARRFLAMGPLPWIRRPKSAQRFNNADWHQV
jgi:hypothetical protein